MGVKFLKEMNVFTYDRDDVKDKKDGAFTVTGILQRADALNQNGRIYPREVLQPQIELYKELVKERRALGELDHADDPVVNLQKVSHVITDIWMDPDGVVKGKVEILPTPMGNILKSLFESNIKVGISSRALGSVISTNEGDIVQDDLHFICWDFVSEPSTPGAWMIKESKEYTRDEIKKIISKQERVNQAAVELISLYNKIKGK
jgi:hypothetical protein